MHLPGESDACHPLSCLCGDLLQYLSRALPPVCGVLLGPARARAVERVLRGGFGDDLSRLDHGDGPRATGPDVEADQDAHASLLLLMRLFAALYDLRLITFVHPQRGVDRLLAGQGIGPTPRFAHGVAVYLPGQVPDELPLQDGAPDGGHLIFRVGIEVEAYDLAFLAVACVLERLGQFQGLHEEVGAYHVVVVEGAPAVVPVLVAELVLRGQEVGVLGQVLAVHYEVLPVHVDLQIGSVHPEGVDLLDREESHTDVLHQDLHSRLRVLVLQKDLHVLLVGMVGQLGDALHKATPDLRIRALESVVIALSARPDDEVSPYSGAEVYAAPQGIYTPATEPLVGVYERAQRVGRVGV